VIPKIEEKKNVITETAGRDFAPEIMNKAKLLLEFLPQYTLEFLCEAVEMAGNIEIEDLMNNLL